MKPSRWSFNILFHLVIPVIILSTAWYAVSYISQNKPQAQRRSGPVAEATLAVETLAVQPQLHQLTVTAYGTIAPRVRGTVVSQVSGVVRSMSGEFADGAWFESQQPLLTIDDRDYQAAVTIASSDLQAAKAQLEEERVRAERARADLARLGKTAQATALALREPQLKAAQARVDSAKATLTLRQLDVERTRIKAPYKGRVVTRRVGEGQFVNQGQVLADIYAVDTLEVKVPVSQSQLRVLGIENVINAPDDFPVLSLVTLFEQGFEGSEQRVWQGKIVRYDSELSDSRQLNLIIQIPPELNTNTPLPQVGQFVAVNIKGQMMDDVYVLPRQSLYEDAYVLVVEQELLQKRAVDIAWHGGEQIVIKQGLRSGDHVVVSPVSDPLPGTRIRLSQHYDKDLHRLPTASLKASPDMKEVQP